LKEKKILLENSVSDVAEKELIIRISSNPTNKLFDLNMISKKGKE
jgi:hypothetical protein